MRFRRTGKHEETNGPDFRAKRPSVNGIAALVIGVIALIMLAAAAVISTKAGGNGDERVGMLGLVSAFSCITGSVVGFQGFKERDVSFLFAYIGTGLNLVMFVYLLFLFLYGMF